ncbi:hypothetical protein EJB05_38701, partial [Eragrostis curvula]
MCILRLGLGLLLVLAARHAPATALPGPECQKKCGDVEIQYPFGIGSNCSLSRSFNVRCKVQDGTPKPFIGDFELLNISLTDSTMRVLGNIATYCYNTSSRSMDVSGISRFNASGSPYRFSDARNKFTVIGCNTLGYISDSNGTGYQSGCVSTCTERSLSDVTDGTCSGIGCCQTTIPRGVDYYSVGFARGLNTSQIWTFSRCSYAMLMEAASFNFSAAYIRTTKFNETNAGRAPVVIDWAIRNGTTTWSCEVAARNETGTYACLSGNSKCVDSANGPGYVCNCSQGYQGNPYLPDGCRDVNECINNPCPSGGVCHNTIGGYRCSCRAGRKFSKQSNSCNPDTGLIIVFETFGMGCVVLVQQNFAASRGRIVGWRLLPSARAQMRSMEMCILRLGLGLLLVLAAQHAPATAIPSPECQKKCGNVEIHYPFGIGTNCSLSESFDISCQVQDGFAKPFIGDLELLNISLADSTIRMLGDIGSYCYNTSSRRMDLGGLPSLNATGSPYRFSNVLNKFTVIGCNTLGYISDSNGTGYQSGCVSTCTERSLSQVTDGTCSGIGCCQTAIPRGMDYYQVGFDVGLNTSLTWRFSRCSYAMLIESASFNFSAAYISTTKFNETNAGQAPLVVDWAIRNGTASSSCEVARRNETGTYACLSGNSKCVDSANGPGYVCNCSQGYQGNPYLPDGCRGLLMSLQMSMNASATHALQVASATTQ